MQLSYDATEQAMLQDGYPEVMVDGVVDKLVNDDSPTTNQGDLSYFEVITGKQPTSLKAWLAKAGAAFQ